jgi:hypothetical protein
VTARIVPSPAGSYREGTSAELPGERSPWPHSALRTHAHLASRTRRAHRARALLALSGVAVAAVVLTGCGNADAGEAPVESHSFPLTVKTLTIDADDSDLRLEPADVKDVQVTQQVDGWVFMGNGPEASWKMEGGKLTFRVMCDAVVSDCRSRHTVKVPRGVAVTVEDDNGNVTATGFDTVLKIRSNNGEVAMGKSPGNRRMPRPSGRGGGTVRSVN